MKKKALIISIAILVVIGIFSFINIFKVGQSFVKHSRFAEGINDITDANLRACVNKAISSAGDGADITTLTELSCKKSGITSLAGITNLTALKKLDVEGNAITGDVVLSGMTALEEIDLSDNEGVTSLTLQSLNMKVFDLDNTSIKDVANVHIGDKDITDRSVLNAKAETLKFKGFTWNDKMKDVILNNAGTLKILSLANTGFNDATFFASNAALFTALTDINLSGNNLASVPLTGLKTKVFVCDNCGLTSITIDKSILQELDVPNNQIAAFYALPEDYPALTSLNLSGNPLQTQTFNATPETGAGLVTNINLSNIKFENFNLNKLNPAAVVTITMHNSNLDGELDFRGFSSSFKNLDISNFSKDDADHPNKVSSIKVTFSNDNTKNSQLTNLNVSGVESFSGIYMEKPEGEQNDADPTLASLARIDFSFTRLSSFDFSKFPGIKSLNFVGCKDFRQLTLTDTQKGQLNAIGVALSGLSADDIPKDSNNLHTIIVDTEIAELLRLASYPGLTKMIVASEKEIYDVTTADSFSNDLLLASVPQNVTGITAFDVYKGYSAQDGNKLNSIPAGKKVQLFMDANNVKVNGVNGFAGTIEYNGYFDTNPIKVSSQKYKFDNLNNERVIVVGDDETGAIVEGVVVSDQDVYKRISDDEKYLILSKGDVEVAKYRLLRVDPSSYTPANPDDPSGGGSGGGGSGGGESGEPDVPGDEGEHSSLDPTEEGGSGGSGNYETTDPTTTGAFISIVSLIVLVIAGVFSQYYMKKKRKEEELIEKI